MPINGTKMAEKIKIVRELTDNELISTKKNHNEARVHLILLAIQTYGFLMFNKIDLIISALVEKQDYKMDGQANINVSISGKNSISISLPLRKENFLTVFLPHEQILSYAIFGIGLALFNDDKKANEFVKEKMESFLESTAYTTHTPKNITDLVQCYVISTDYKEKYIEKSIPSWPLIDWEHTRSMTEKKKELAEKKEEMVKEKEEKDIIARDARVKKLGGK